MADDSISVSQAAVTRSPLREVIAPFLRLGLTAFGGPAAHIALMQEEFVHRRQWLAREDFLDMLGASSLIPGPTSTEVAMHIGHRHAGWRGLLTSGTCFILPAFCMVLICAWAYVRYGSLPQVAGIMYGVKPVVIAIIVQALWTLARTAIKSPWLGLLAALVTLGTLLQFNMLAMLLAAGVLAMALTWLKVRREVPIALALMPAAGGSLATGAAMTLPASTAAVFAMFLKFGAIVFGSGYVLLAFLQTDLVDRLHWLTRAQLLDAIVVGQLTPGPVFTTATFIGYLVNGIGGAVAATVAIFLPGFCFVAASRPLIPRLRRSRWAAAFMDGVNAAAVALIIAVTLQLGRAAIFDPATAAVAAISGFLLVYYRVNGGWLMLAGALFGLALSA
jgi:chromate transporter